MTNAEKQVIKDRENARMRAASGDVRDTRPLVAFLYQLARDHLPVGLIEECIPPANPEYKGVVFTNGWLATWAKDAADRFAPVRVSRELDRNG